MQSLAHLRRFAALIPLALAFGPGLQPAAAQAQVAASNAVPVVGLGTSGIENPPRNIRGGLLLADDGNIYFGSTGGGKGAGAIGRLTPDGVLSTLYALADNGNDGVSVWNRLYQASDGHLYGVAFIGGGEGLGTLFRVTLEGEFTVLHKFGGGDPNPERPYTGVVEAADGYLYGTTLFGGTTRKGTIYRITKDGTDFTVLHHFRGNDGENPEGTLVDGQDGYLYGTTLKGGSSNRGTIYRISTATGEHELLYSFPSLSRFRNGVATNSTGSDPRAGLLLAADGYLYGTAYQGGAHGHGTVFRIARGDNEVEVLHAFEGASFDGARPISVLTQDADGYIYGTTEYGGAMNQGAAWRLAPDGSFKLLHSFNINAHGVTPHGGILPAHGTLYVASQYDYLDSYGGPVGSGTILRLETDDAGPLLLQMSASAQQITFGESVTIEWNWTGPTDWTCSKIGGSMGWPGETTHSGTATLQPQPATYTYGIRCAEPDDDDTSTPVRSRMTQVAVVVNAPQLTPVDGGGGAGSLSMWWLLLAASLLFRKVLKERRSSCP